MFRSILMGLVAGQRAMTPLAALAGAAREGRLPNDSAAARLMASPLPAVGAVAIAAAEMAGDKMKSAPDRIVVSGLLARSATAAFAGATLAEKDRRVMGALLGASAAIASSYVGWSARMWALRRYGQTVTGAVEDAIVMSAALAIANARPKAA